MSTFMNKIKYGVIKIATAMQVSLKIEYNLRMYNRFEVAEAAIPTKTNKSCATIGYRIHVHPRAVIPSGGSLIMHMVWFKKNTAS